MIKTFLEALFTPTRQVESDLPVVVASMFGNLIGCTVCLNEHDAEEHIFDLEDEERQEPDYDPDRSVTYDIWYITTSAKLDTALGK